jgi:acetyl esterase/lipase
LRITDLNPDWRETGLCPQRSYRWTCDGGEVEGLLVLPSDAPEGRPSPLVVYVHGGPHSVVQNTLKHGACLQWLARMGYAVLAPNYRGSAGYGAAFSVANRKDLGGGDYRDILAGVDSLVADGIADPERLAIMGGSYGGYMTNWAISQTDRFRAAVSMFGIFNWITDFSNSEVSNFEPDYFGGYYWEDPTLYVERSPFRHVQNIRTPVLIMHGESDSNTFISNSREMHQALRALGRTVRFIRYPREEHGFMEPRHRADMHYRIARWLEAHLIGEGADQPSIYRMDQDVPGEDGWTIRVTSADPVTLAGRAEPEDAAFLQVVFALSSAREKAARRIALNELRAEAAGAEAVFLGAPLKTLDETVLIEGGDLSIAFKGGEPPSAFPIAAAFQIPKGASEMTLRVPGFPPVLLPLPKSDSKTEESERETHKIVHDEESAAIPGPGQKPRVEGES